MIQLQQVSLQRGTRFLLSNADLTLHSGWKIGIIGNNGVGKSSLFQLLLGQLSPDQGELLMSAGLTLSHMAQEVDSSSQSALDYLIDGDHALRSVQQRLREAEAAQTHHLIGELHAELEHLDGYRVETRAHQLLTGLGFAAGDAERPVSAFSGGWRIRLNLARALMCRSDILLLDEPTNHLDLDATLWLEQWLRNYPGTLLLISHDRDFLDNVVSHIVHMHQQQLSLYKGNYSTFERTRAERLAQQQAAYDKQQTRVAQIENFVRRFRAKATKAKQAQSRLKELERMELIAPAHVDSPFSFSFIASDKISTPLLNLDRACLGYAGQRVLEQVSLTLMPGERIGLLGPNGAGKSTLIKTLVGDLPLQSGRVTCGEHLKVGYFAQHQLEALDLQASPFLHLQRLSPQATDQQIRDFLGSFDFHGDAALSPVSGFSGGEKARVALALIAWQRPNLLLLDEPTNHLDLEVCHALTLALQEFEGALILVSHDRHLVRNTVDRFLLVAEGRVSGFDGDLEDYQLWLAQRRKEDQPSSTTAPTDNSERSLSAAEKKDLKRLQAERRQRLRPLKQQAQAQEQQIETLSARLQQLQQQLTEPDLYEAAQKELLKQLLAEQTQVTQAIEEVEQQWLELLEQIEAFERDMGD